MVLEYDGTLIRLRVQINALTCPGVPLSGDGVRPNGSAGRPAMFTGQIIGQGRMMTAGSTFHGNYMGVDLWESGNVATEAGAANSFIMQIGGRHAVLNYVRQRQLRVEFSRGDEMQSRQSNQWTLSWADGYGINRQDEFIEAQFDAAA